MAVYNEILVGRFNRFCQKHFGLKGGPPAPQLAGEIAMNMTFNSGSENRYLEAWNLWAGRVSLAAGGAGNFGVVRFANPAGSNIVAVLQRILFISAAGDNPNLSIAVGLNLPSLGAAGTFSVLDFRSQSVGSNITVSAKNNTVAQGSGTLISTGAVSAVNIPFDFITDAIMEQPCLPNTSYDIASANSNNGFTVSLIWRERFLDDSERA
jgi:hypothetical protein